MAHRRILLIVGGGIAAYKSCELVRLIRKQGGEVTCVLTAGGARFVTEMTLAALSGSRVHTSLWDAGDEAEIGHIQLSRAADLVVVCPASADLLAKMAAGIADDLATTLLLATDKPVLAVPAMNVRMWQHTATRRNVAQLRNDGVLVMEPDEGPMACGEFGPGRLPEPQRIWGQIDALLGSSGAPGSSVFAQEPSKTASPQRPDDEAHDGALKGRHVLVTAGPTHEAIDPVRYLANRSSGKQGFAIAAAAVEAGARVTLVTGPVQLETPAGVKRIEVESAAEMARAVEEALPADCAIMVAAVADWRVRQSRSGKIKKDDAGPPTLELIENIDILASLASAPGRPRLLVGFAAETEEVVAHARAKRVRKGADWIVANDVSGDVMGGADNEVHLVRSDGVESWKRMRKEAVAAKLVAAIALELAGGEAGHD